jgi:hypothetical protein
MVPSDAKPIERGTLNGFLKSVPSGQLEQSENTLASAPDQHQLACERASLIDLPAAPLPSPRRAIIAMLARVPVERCEDYARDLAEGALLALAFTIGPRGAADFCTARAAELRGAA